MIPGGGFNPEDPSHWANLFAMALSKFGGGMPSLGAGLPSGPLEVTTGTPEIQYPRPQQGQGLGGEGSYGGDDYAHAGWGTAQPFDYSTYHHQAPPKAMDVNQRPMNEWESYWNWLGRYAQPFRPSGYHVGGRY